MKLQTIGPDMIIAVGLSISLILAIVLNVGSEISTTIAAGLVGYIGKVATSSDFNHEKLVDDISKNVNDKADSNHKIVTGLIDQHVMNVQNGQNKVNPKCDDCDKGHNGTIPVSPLVSLSKPAGSVESFTSSTNTKEEESNRKGPRNCNLDKVNQR